MISLAKNPRPTRLFVRQPFEPSSQRIKVSLHLLVNELLASLQPLAMKNKNVVLNGIPEGICVVAEENLLAYVVWNLVASTLQSRKNECIHVHTLVDNKRTMICVKEAGGYKGTHLASEYRKVQQAAEKIGGHIQFFNDGQNLLIAFSIPNLRIVQAPE